MIGFIEEQPVNDKILISKSYIDLMKNKLEI